MNLGSSDVTAPPGIGPENLECSSEVLPSELGQTVTTKIPASSS